MNKYIIDTDIGDDIDDAFAIVYALKANLNVIGITTVFRNSDRRAKMVARLLKTLNRQDIPVFAGIDLPEVAPIIDHNNDLYDSQNKFIPCQYLQDMEQETYQNVSAVDYIIQTVRENPGEITMVLIGPQTNMAAALKKAPDIACGIKEIIMMAGKYYDEPCAEWNILCDPEAAQTVFSSGIPIKAVGLDVTMQCKMEGDLLQKLKEDSAGTSTLLQTLMKQWFDHYKFDAPVLHDPLTIGTILEDYVEFEPCTVQVDTSPQHYGFMLQDGGCKVLVGKRVKNQEFLSDFIDMICG